MPVYTQVILSPDPLYLQTKSYDARSDRKALADIISPGVVGVGHFAVTATAGNRDIGIAAGWAYILGQNIPDQGMYRQYISLNQVLTVPANGSGNPRIDTVILRIMDDAADSSGFNEPRIEIVPGTPTAGADLNNTNGKANLTTLGEGSKSVLALAYVLVPTGATVLTTVGNIKDIRPRASVGSGQSFGGLPIGATLEWNATAVPSGGFYLTEDGSAISRTVYAGAFAILGTAHGAGDGSTTFNIPDSRGRVPVGYAPSGGHADVSTMGATDGLALGVRRTRHKHTVTDPGHAHTIPNFFGAAGVNYQDTGGGRNLGTVTGVTDAGITGVQIGPQTGSEPVDGPAFIVKHKIIRVA